MPNKQTLYTTTQFMDWMNAQGYLVKTKPTYLKYENLGVFIPGRFSIVFKHRIDRLFTMQEMEENRDRYEAYKKNKASNKKSQ